MIKNDNVHIVIPVYNEEKIILKVIDNLIKHGYKNLILIDDGSQDSSYETIKNSKYKVILLRHLINLGQGAALQTGIEKALELGAEIIITFDSDGQHNPKSIPYLINPIIKHNYDIVLGNRFGIKNKVPFLRKLFIKAGTIFNFLTTGLLLHDAHNGLRAFTKKTAQLLNLKHNRMEHATEFISFIKKNKLKYCEVPVEIRYTEYSKKDQQSIFNAFNIAFKIIISKIFNI